MKRGGKIPPVGLVGEITFPLGPNHGIFQIFVLHDIDAGGIAVKGDGARRYGSRLAADVEKSAGGDEDVSELRRAAHVEDEVDDIADFPVVGRPDVGAVIAARAHHVYAFGGGGGRGRGTGGGFHGRRGGGDGTAGKKQKRGESRGVRD